MNKVIKYTELAFYMFQKNTRKINAIIKRSQIHRIKIYVMLTLLIFQSLNSVFAIENPNIQYENIDIKYRIDSKSYIRYNGILQRNTEYYYIKNDEEYTAYCIELGLNGAELHPEGHYEVSATQKINDEILNRIVLNSYPYKSVEELNLKTKDEAIFASQFAIWCYTNNLDLNLIEAASSEYNYVVECIKNIYNTGVNTNEKYDIKLENIIGPQMIEEVEEIYYYIKEVELTDINNINSINVTSSDNNVKIIEENNKYKVCIPVDNVDKIGNYNVELSFEIEAKENVALIGTTSLVGYQSVVATLKNIFNYTEQISINFEAWNSKIIVKKIDKDTLESIEGVLYEVCYEDGEVIGNYRTDENGEFVINLKNGTKCCINIKEIEAKSGYVKDDEIHRVDIDINEVKNITLSNERAKGYIQINKKTKEYNEITMYKENFPLSGVSFNIYDEQGNKVDDVTTDEFGKAMTKELAVGKYYIQEYKTQEGYKLLDEKIAVEILANGEVVQVNVLNDNVDIPKELPITGK